MQLGIVSYLLDFLVVFLHSQNFKTYSMGCLFLVFLTIIWVLNTLVGNCFTDEALLAPFLLAATHRNISLAMRPAELHLNLLFSTIDSLYLIISILAMLHWQYTSIKIARKTFLSVPQISARFGSLNLKLTFWVISNA